MLSATPSIGRGGSLFFGEYEMRKIWNVILTVLIVLMVLFLIFNGICFYKRAQGDQCPTVFGMGMAIVTSGSMEPSISVDDLVVICHQDSYNLRDVVTYYGTTYPVTHRIVRIQTDENGEVLYTTKGDANTPEDGEIPADQIVGRVILVIPKVGKLQRFIQSSEGFLTLSLIALGLIALSEILNTAGRKRRR